MCFNEHTERLPNLKLFSSLNWNFSNKTEKGFGRYLAPQRNKKKETQLCGMEFWNGKF